MLKRNWSTAVFGNHGGSFSSILRWLPSRAGDFAGPAVTDISHYWRWSKRLTEPLLIQLPSHVCIPPASIIPWSCKFLFKNLAREKCFWYIFFPLLISCSYIEMTKLDIQIYVCVSRNKNLRNVLVISFFLVSCESTPHAFIKICFDDFGPLKSIFTLFFLLYR